MAILTDVDIRRIVNKWDLVIHPVNEDSITGLGYDLHIGKIQPLKELPGFALRDGMYYIPPNCYCVIITEEYLWLSSRLAGTLHARGTLAAKGLFTNATNVDPNFKGQMIMSMVNLSNAVLTLEKGDTFITLMLHEVSTPTKMLVGKEGTKNSMRVIKDLAALYTNPQEANKVATFNEYVTESNTNNRPKFDLLVEEAKKFVSFKMFKAYFQPNVKQVEMSLTKIILKLVTGTCIVFALWSTFKITTEVIFSKTSFTKEDLRMLAVVCAAILSIVINLIKK